MDYTLKTDDAYAALRIKDYRRFIYARFLITFAIQMQSVIVGWQVYEITKDPLSLGLIGLSEAIPFLLIALFAGHIADIINRKKIIVIAVFVYLVCAAGLFVISTSMHTTIDTYGVIPIYIIIFITGLARGFMSPAQSAFGAQLVPREIFGNSSTWNSLVWQIAEISGPAMGGLLYGIYGIGYGYGSVILFCTAGLIIFTTIKNRPLPVKTQKESINESLKTGLRFVKNNQFILSAISLDMFAVFFGGAISILPMFADQVLNLGAEGLGFLRAAPACGALIMVLVQAYHPPFNHAGRNLLLGVTGFGISIILFALSENFYLAFFALMMSGVCDNVSVIIRATIIQLYTPDEMRGRVASVNSIFIGSSNELGSFESGLAAKIMGLIPSILFGGSMTIATVAMVYRLAPKLRTLKL